MCLVGSDQCRIYRSWSWRVGQKSVDYWFCVTLPSQWRCLTTVRLFNYVIAAIHPRSGGDCGHSTARYHFSYRKSFIQTSVSTVWILYPIFYAKICSWFQQIYSQCLMMETWEDINGKCSSVISVPGPVAVLSALLSLRPSCEYFNNDSYCHLSSLSLFLPLTVKKSLPSLNFRKCQIQNFRSFLKVQGEFQCF